MINEWAVRQTYNIQNSSLTFLNLDLYGSWYHSVRFPHPMAELVLNRCVYVESSCHGQGHLETLILQEKHNITIYKNIGIKRLKLINICVLVVIDFTRENSDFKSNPFTSTCWPGWALRLPSPSMHWIPFPKCFFLFSINESSNHWIALFHTLFVF